MIMESQSYQSSLSPDQVNYFAYIGEAYPDKRIAYAKGKLFVSLFDYDKAYLITKVANVEILGRANEVRLSAYRTGCALFLGIMLSESGKALFETVFPINPKAARFPIYPSDDESLSLDVHYVDLLSNELNRVFSLLPSDHGFTQQFVLEYQTLRDEQYSADNFCNSVAKFFSQSLTEQAKDKLFETDCVILKAEPEKDEPRRTSVLSLSEQLMVEDKTV